MHADAAAVFGSNSKYILGIRPILCEQAGFGRCDLDEYRSTPVLFVQEVWD